MAFCLILIVASLTCPSMIEGKPGLDSVRAAGSDNEECTASTTCHGRPCERGTRCCLSSVAPNQIIRTNSELECCKDSQTPVYNKTTSFCIGTKVEPRNKFTGFNLEQCGGNKVYDPSKEECRRHDWNDFRVVPKTVAATTTASPVSDSFSCVRGESDCCSGRRFTYKQLCTPRGGVVEKKHIGDTETCGPKLTYDPDEFMCRRSPYRLEPIAAGRVRCGPESIDPNVDLCCEGVPHWNGTANGARCCQEPHFVALPEEICCRHNVFERQRGFRCCRSTYKPKNECRRRRKEPVLDVYLMKISRKKTRGGTCRFVVVLMQKGQSPGKDGGFSNYPYLVEKNFKLVLRDPECDLIMEDTWVMIAITKHPKKTKLVLKTQGKRSDWFIWKRLPSHVEAVYNNFLYRKILS